MRTTVDAHAGRTEPAVAARRLAVAAQTVAVVFVLVAVAARSVADLANADALLPALISTQNLTVFFWEQDRLANVVPLLAFPVRDVDWNLAVQWTIVGSGVFVLVALFVASHLEGSGRPVRASSVIVPLLITSLVLGFALTDATAHILLFEQMYALALSLFLLGLFGVMSDGLTARAAGVACTIAVLVLNPSLLLFTPVALVLPATIRSTRRLAVAGSTVAGAFVLSSVLTRARATDGSDEAYSDFAIDRLLEGAGDAWRNIVDAIVVSTSVPALVVAASLLLLARHRLDARLRATYLVAPLFALAWFGMFSANLWVEQNGYIARYYFPVFAVGALVLTGGVVEAVELLRTRIGGVLLARRGGRGPGRAVAVASLAMAGVAFAGAVVVARGVPVTTLEEARQRVNVGSDLGASYVAGTYWTVWPTVVEARSQGLDWYGVTYRSDPTLEQVVAEMEEDLRTDGAITVVCTDGDAALCAEQVSFEVQRRWLLDEVVREAEPTVVRLEPAADPGAGE